MREYLDWLSSNPFSLALSDAGWVVPVVQMIHIVSIAVLVSSVLMIDLRVMGWTARSQPLITTVTRFRPWFWGALLALALTGILMIVIEPVRELMAISFWVKMAALAVGVAIAVTFLRSLDRNEAYWQESAAVKSRTKALGVATFLVWIAVIFLGRFIAYDNQIWGSLSPLY